MSDSALSTPTDSIAGQVLPVDRYHTGVRLAALGLWFAAVGGLYAAGRWLYGLLAGEISGASLLILVVGAFLLAQPLARFGEQQLLKLWPSGRSLHLGSGAVTLRERSRAARIDLGQKVNYWRWRFEIRGRRGGRVPNGHFCVAVRLAQPQAAFSVYAFAPPQTAQTLAARYAFHELRGSLDGSGNKPPLGGRDAVYLAAERARWESGAEVEPADFERLLDHLSGAVPDFKSATAS